MSKNFIFFLAGSKGLLLLRRLVTTSHNIFHVYISVDKNVDDDSSLDIFNLCSKYQIPHDVIDAGQFCLYIILILLLQ